MKVSTDRSDLFWSYLAQGLNVGYGLLILPIFAYYMSKEDIGLWFLFISASSLAILIEGGFQPSVIRNFSYVYAGARELVPIGPPVRTEGWNAALAGDLFRSVQWIYRNGAGILFTVLLVAGTSYFFFCVPTHDLFIVAIAWALFALGTTIFIYFGCYSCAVIGHGEIGVVNKSIVVSRILFILLASLLLSLDLGLIGLGLAHLTSNIVARAMVVRYFTQGAGGILLTSKFSRPVALQVFHVLRPTSLKQIGVALGGFLALRANLFVAGGTLGLTESAEYGFSLQLALVLVSVATAFSATQIPRLAYFQVTERREALGPILAGMLLIAWLIYLPGAAIVIYWGPSLVPMLGLRGLLLPTGELALLLVIMLLEMTHGLCATFITTTNDVPFLRAALLSGISTLVVSLFLSLQLNLGVWGLLLAQGVVQLSYNNWKWPYEALRLAKLPMVRVLASGFAELKEQFLRGKAKA